MRWKIIYEIQQKIEQRARSKMSAVFPPRGLPVEEANETAPAATWEDPSILATKGWGPGDFVLGVRPGSYLRSTAAYIGIMDDRHVVIIAGSRSGKTKTVLEPNLEQYPGACLIIDPKGELAEATHDARQKFGPVRVVDPFGITRFRSAKHNPLDELRLSPLEDLAANAAQFAEALIVETRDTHWSDSARSLVKGIVLYLLCTTKLASMADLRSALCAGDSELADLLLTMMAVEGETSVAATIRNVGSSFRSMIEFNADGEAVGHTREFGSILSTARQQTASFDDLTTVTSGHSGFSFDELSTANLTIYLVLPGMRLATHSRWLRLLLLQAAAAMEARPRPRTVLPAWFVLEEFPALGYVRTIEMAAGYMAGFGVKLIVILQDLAQLQRHYDKSWETFLGNAGVIQAFGVVDRTTTTYLSQLLGQRQITEYRQRFASSAERAKGASGIQVERHMVPLLDPTEVAIHFGRRTHRSLIVLPGEKPFYLQRVPYRRS